MAEPEPTQGEPDEGTPTITTVARLANVSIASASRALNGIRTSPETLARVREAAEAIGYVPNAAARSLRSRRTGQIVFAMPDVGNPVYTTMVASIQEATRESGWRLMLHSTGADTEDELAIVRDLRHRFADGLILATLDVTDAHVDELRHAATPVVVIGRPSNELGVDVVRAYSRKGAAEAVRHLHGAGRRRIALLNGPRDTPFPAPTRRLGYFDGLRSCDLRRDDRLAEVAPAFTVQPGRRGDRAPPRAIPPRRDPLHERPARGRRPRRAARREASTCPGDVALVGMDNTPLSRAHVAAAHVGRPRAPPSAPASPPSCCSARIDGSEAEPRVVGVEPTLVVRASSGAGA